MFGLKRALQNKLRIFAALLLMFSYTVAPLSPFIGKAYAAAPPTISVSKHEGQESPAGTYTSGNVTTYQEGDEIDFHFTLSSNGVTSGQMAVDFTVDDTCTFFDGTFQLGSIDLVSGTVPSVTTNGSPTDIAGIDYRQLLDVSFPSATDSEAVVNYTLTLSQGAGECNGSSQHSRLSNIGTAADGDFKNIGQQNVPVPADKIIELPEIFVEKWIDSDGDGTVDRRATAGEWSFSLDGGTPVATDANGMVTFVNVTPDGNHTVTESGGPANQAFLTGSGTNCTFNGAIATANVAKGATATDATCIFNNGIPKGNLTIIKDALPNADQDFNFSSNVPGAGNAAFILDDDGNNANTYSNSKSFSNITPGTYTVTETGVNGWSLTDLSCTGTTSYSQTNNQLSVTVGSGENITCTFTNTQHGKLIVEKQTLPDGDQTDFTIEASGNNTIFTTAEQTISDGETVEYEVLPGTYTVDETVPTGWQLTNTTCEDVVVAAGATVNCLLENTKDASLTIVKDADPNDSQDFGFTVSSTKLTNNETFSLDDDADATLSNSETLSNLTPGDYTVAEGAVTGWDLSNLDCGQHSFSENSDGLTITLAAGENVSCTFTNTQRGSISGTKYGVNADGTTDRTLSGWTIELWQGGNKIDDTTTDANGDYSFDNLVLGEYSVIEIMQNGFTQIYSPNAITLSAGQNSQDNDFGNFLNGSIAGFKYNDFNGNGSFDSADEDKIQGWEITYTYEEGDDDLYDDGSDTTNTDVSGSFSFTNLAPGDYKVCETPQNNWVRTQPAASDCYNFTIDDYGEAIQDVAFGNRGQGTITVVKHVDTDGDGNIDIQDSTDWIWNIDGSGDFATGSNNPQTVFAGTYQVSEEDQDDYHFEVVNCTGETVQQGTAVNVTVSPGEEVICTFTNTRDTGTIKVVKQLVPENDSGLFDLYVDQTLVKADASDDDDGSLQVVTGSYKVSELAGSNTSLSDYDSTYSCDDSQSTNGSGTVSGFVSVSSNQTVTCTFTNTRKATLTIEKVTNPDDSSQVFDFTSIELGSFSLDGNGDDQDGEESTIDFSVSPGEYSVSEDALTGWDLTDLDCAQHDFTDNGDGLTITLAAGDNVTCTFTNTQRGSVTLVKQVDTVQTDSFDFDFTSDISELNTTLSASATHEGSQTVDNVLPGDYVITEDIPDGWDLTNISCDTRYEVQGDDDTAHFAVRPGQDVTCTFSNEQLATVNITKYNDYDLDGIRDSVGQFGEEPALEGWELFLDDDTQTTPEDGTVTFTNVKAGYHVVGENLQDDWNFSNILCDGQFNQINLLQIIQLLPDNSEYVGVLPGETVNCEIGNYQDLELEITKSNDQPDATVVGDTVTYTLVVTLPEDSGASFDTVVTDLPPEGFDYQTGSWTASSNFRGDLKAANVTTEPTYGSPGQWQLGAMLPGEVVTLTYVTLITSGVTPGDYPDIAFVSGYDSPIDGNEVFGNIQFADDPFVGTQVSVIEPQVLGDSFQAQVLGISRILPNTGGEFLLAFLPAILSFLFTYLFLYRYYNRKELRV